MLKRILKSLRFRLFTRFSAKPPTQKSLLENQFLYDFQLFCEYSAFSTGTLYKPSQSLSNQNLEALISIEYHRLEKGLSHPMRRDIFGTDAAQRLTSALCEAKRRGFNSSITSYANEVLASYQQEIKGVGNQEIGWKTIKREEILSGSSIDAKSFFQSRHSIRCFDPAHPASIDQINEAIALARYTPSVCNRQTWRVIICASTKAKEAALSLQNGNKGFGHLASHVLIVASDRSGFASIGERNQPWIEGGLFSMSLVYALHALGLGTCCLNWSVDNQRDAELKQALDIPASYAIAMMIAVGSLPATIPVAESRRLAPDDLMEIR
jgi:nitroreductase